MLIKKKVFCLSPPPPPPSKLLRVRFQNTVITSSGLARSIDGLNIFYSLFAITQPNRASKKTRALLGGVAGALGSELLGGLALEGRELGEGSLIMRKKQNDGQKGPSKTHTRTRLPS